MSAMTDAPTPKAILSEDELAQRLLGFEVLLADFSAAFVAAFPSDLDGLMTHWLLRVVEFLDLDRSSVARFRPDGTLELAHFAALPGIEPTTEVPFERFDWYVDEMRRGRTIVLPRLPDDLPPGAAAEREYAVRSGIKANLSIPLSVGGERVGVIGFAGFRYPRPWPPEIFHRLRVVGDVIGNALARKQAEESLRRSEARLRRVLEAFPEALMLVRADGSIFFANAAASESFGYKRAEMLDMPVERLVPALNREIRAAARSASEAVRDLSNVVSRQCDGTEMLMDVRAIKSGAGEGELVCLFRLARAPLP